MLKSFKVFLDAANPIFELLKLVPHHLRIFNGLFRPVLQFVEFSYFFVENLNILEIFTIDDFEFLTFDFEVLNLLRGLTFLLHESSDKLL